VRLVAAYPPPSSLCQDPLPEGTRGNPGPEGALGRLRAVPAAYDGFCIRLLLADPTAFLPVLLCDEDAVSGAPQGWPSSCITSTNAALHFAGEAESLTSEGRWAVGPLACLFSYQGSWPLDTLPLSV